MHRAYSVIEIKAVDKEQRIIEGIATTPKTDRVGDIIEPEGAVFKLPIPLLWQHRGDSPIGHVIEARVTNDGIHVRAQIERMDEPGELKNLLDRAWQSIGKKLVRGLSIGFSPLEWSDIKGTFGQRFTSWEWLELSAVTIPANVDATITSVKQFDTNAPAVPGNGAHHIPAAAGRVVSLTKTKPPEGKMTVTERIGAAEAKRAANVARMGEITKSAGDANRTMDAPEQEEWEGLDEEIKSLDGELVRLKRMEELNAQQANPVNGQTTTAATDSRSTEVVVTHPAKLEPGIEFARYAMCVAAAKGDPTMALRLAETHYPQQMRAITVMKAARDVGMEPHRFIAQLAETATKAAVAAGTTTQATWAAPLVEYNQFAGDFIEYLRARTIIGRFGRDGIPDLNRIPFNVHIRGQTSGGSASWVGQGKAKPVTKFDFNDTYHGFFKIAAIAVLVEELIRFSNPSSERLTRDALGGAVIARIDSDFVDPAITAVANVNPASITAGVSVTPGSGGVDEAAVRADIAALWADAIAANLPLTSAVYITTPTIALNLSLMSNALGQAPRGFDVTMTGGTLLGVPVIVSNYVPAGTFILAFASEIWLSDDGVVTVDASREASIEMLDSALQGDATSGTGASLVSMFQTNSVALRAERYINWSKRRSTAVRLLEDVVWGTEET
jgi:HK97 family phage prohead protease/HK97 family phage major capsid protein